MNAPPPGAAPGRTSRVRSLGLFAVGLTLTGLAVWFAARGAGGGALGRSWQAARDAPVALGVAALLLPAVNWALTSLVFLVLTRAAAPVRAAEMGALIGAAGLYNYLPLRPGLVGRVAYHRSVHSIPVMVSVRILAITIAISGVGVLLLLLASVAATRLAAPEWKLVLLASPAVVSGFIAWFAFTRGMGVWRLAAALSLRSLDLLLWTGRYAVVFSLIGRGLDPAQAAAIAGVSQIVSVIPLAGNGLGLREWAVGWASVALPAWYAAAAPTADVGLSADLLNRGAELPAAIAIGIGSTVWLARRARAAQGAGSRTSSATT